MDLYLFVFPLPSYENSAVSHTMLDVSLLFAGFATGAYLGMVFVLIVESLMGFGIFASPDKQPKKYVRIWLKG